jgi:RNA polymerase sigma-70 factor (family 1)
MIAAQRLEELRVCITTSDDESAYKELFINLYPHLHAFAMQFMKSKQLSEEVVSDVFIKIWERRKSLMAIQNFKIYLFVATKNTALNYLNKNKSAPLSLDDFPGEFNSSYADPEQLMITSDMMKLINQAILNLPPRCRTIFQLVKYDRMKYKEVAEILNISAKTVENQLAIAIRKIGSSISFDMNRAIPSSISLSGS